MVSDFCVFIAIIIVSMCDALVGIGTPKLITPAKFAVSINPTITGSEDRIGRTQTSGLEGQVGTWKLD